MIDNMAGVAPDAVFDCGEGWRDLIAKAAAEVAAWPDDWQGRIVGGSVKDGGLWLEIWFEGRWPYETAQFLKTDYHAMSLAICKTNGTKRT